MKTKVGLYGRFSHDVLVQEKDFEFSFGHDENADFAIVRSHQKIDEKFLSQFKDLKGIVSATSGFDHIDMGIDKPLGYTPKANVTSVAEHALMLMLEGLKRTTERRKLLKQGYWAESRVLMGRNLNESTVSLIGLGRVGKRVSQMLKSLGVRKIYAHDPYLREADFEKAGVISVGLEEAFRLGEVISLHLPLTKRNRHMINRKTLEWISSESILINTARGLLLNEMDVIEALQNEEIAGLGLDVFEREPQPSKLYTNPRVAVTPHSAAKTESAFRASTKESIESIKEFLRTGKFTDPLPPKDPWYIDALSSDERQQPQKGFHKPVDNTIPAL